MNVDTAPATNALVALFCRLCTKKIKDSPVRLTSTAPFGTAESAAIIHQHYGIDVFCSAVAALTTTETFLCAQCWTTTQQFHQLYTAVQQHESVWLGRAAVQPLGANEHQTAAKITLSTSTDAVNNVSTGSPIKSETGPTSQMLECKVEIMETDGEGHHHGHNHHHHHHHHQHLDGADAAATFDDDAYDDGVRGSSVSSPTPSQQSDSSESSDSSASLEPAPRKRGRPKQGGSGSGPPKRKNVVRKERTGTEQKRIIKRRTPDEIAEQNIRIREYFSMSCDQCEARFEVLRDAISHYRREHDSPGYLKCCGKKFFNRTLVLDHIAHHANPDAFHCDRCDRSYISQAALKLHLVSHDKQLPKPYKCVVCAADFVKYFQLTQHQRQKHLVSTAKSFGCDICGKFFFTKWQMSTHIHSVHIAAHICDICATTFKSKAQLDMHYRRVHIGEIKPKVQCSICAAWLSDERSLRKHIDRHSQVTAVCTLCGKVTPNQYALGSHMRYVHAERIYPCTMCDKSFKRAIGLREHMAAHTGVDLYTCTYCPRTFKSNSNMFAHRKKSHPLEWGRDRDQRNQA